MKTEIELGLLEGICVAFENVEVVYVPATYIHKLEVVGIKQNKYLNNAYEEEVPSVRELTVSDWVNMTIQEFGDTEETLEKGSLFSQYGDDYNGYMRLAGSQDIVSLTYMYKDGTQSEVYVDYSDEDMYYDPNYYQENTTLITADIFNGVNICIASPKTKDKMEVGVLPVAEVLA